MKTTNIILFIFLFRSGVFFAGNKDSLFFADLRSFYNNKTQHTIHPELFTKWAENEKLPFCYVYVSKKDKVENALKESFVYCAHDTMKSANYCKEYSEKGYSTFNYKTYGTSDTRITNSLLSYRSESKAFVVFHELTHNYFTEKKIKVNYQVNEAVCDVLGIYFASELCKKDSLQFNKVRQTQAYESLCSIYHTINEAIAKINSNEKGDWCSQAETKIQNAIHGLDIFYMNRFNYPVNNAYLLKCSNYCTYFFEMEDLYLKNPAFKDFMKAVIQFNSKLK